MRILLVLLLSAASFAQTDILVRGINKATTGPNEFGDTGKAFNAYWNCSRQWIQVSTPPDNNYCGRVYMEVLSGGVNGANKSQFGGMDVALVKRTIGQMSGYHAEMGAYSTGDAQGFSAEVTGYGGCLTGGDECYELLRGDVTQGTVQFSATVTGVSGTSISYGTATNDNTRGQNRAVIITTPAKVYSTGTVSSISGVAPIVTGSGTSWLSLGSGAVSNLFFELTGCNGSGLDYVVPVRSIASDTSLTLNFSPLGADSGWTCSSTSGAYKIFKGGTATDVSVSGTVIVSPAGDFAASDTIAEPLSYAYANNGGIIHAFSTYSLPPAYEGGAMFFGWHNTAAYPMGYGIYLPGYYHRGIVIGANGAVTGPGLSFPVAVGGALVESTDTSAPLQHFFQIFNASSALRGLDYDRTNDWWTWLGGQYFSAIDQRFGYGTNPQANTLGYYFWNNAAWNGLILAPAVAANAGKAYFSIEKGGVQQFRIYELKTVLANSSDLKIYSDSELTLKASIAGATGNAVFNGLVTVGASALVTGGSAINTLLLSPTDSGPYVFASRDTSSVTRLGITNSGDIQKPATTASDFIFEDLATTKDIVLKTNGVEVLRGKPSGKAVFTAGVCYNAAATVCDTAGAGAPAGACTTGSTYRNTTGGALTTFYVCEAAAWVAK